MNETTEIEFVSEPIGGEIMSGTNASVTVDPGPQRMQFNRSTGIFTALPCLFIAVYLALVIFFIVMAWKFVRAHEKIANTLERGIKIRKDEIDI